MFLEVHFGIMSKNQVVFYMSQLLRTIFYIFIIYSCSLSFAKIDNDGNGISDIWEIKYFHYTGVNPNYDTDGDGSSNLEESVSGTNPFHQDTYTVRGSVPSLDSLGKFTIGIQNFTGTNNESYTYVYWWGIAGKKYTPVWSVDLINFYPYRNESGVPLSFSPDIAGELGYVVRNDAYDTDGDDIADTVYTYQPQICAPDIQTEASVYNIRSNNELQFEEDTKPIISIAIAGGWYGSYSRINYYVDIDGVYSYGSVLSEVNVCAMALGSSTPYTIIELDDYDVYIDFTGTFSDYVNQGLLASDPTLEDNGFSGFTNQQIANFQNKLQNSTDAEFITDDGIVDPFAQIIAILAFEYLHNDYKENKLAYTERYTEYWQLRKIAEAESQVQMMRTISDTLTPEEQAIKKRNTEGKYFFKVLVDDIEESDGRTKAERLEVTMTDSNGNGLPDWWENWHYGKVLSGSELTNQDFDGDGIKDTEEYLYLVNHNRDVLVEYDKNNMVIKNMGVPISRDNEGNILSHGIIE